MYKIQKIKFRIQRKKKARVQSPESRVQSPESRVQSPESSPAFRLCHFWVSTKDVSITGCNMLFIEVWWVEGTSVLFIKRSINCSCVSFGNPVSSYSNGSSSICNASSRTVSSAMVSLNPCCNFNLFKSFCLRDRGRLGNEGRPISLKIGTQSRHVDLCNMPKFQVQRPFFTRVLDISPSGVPRGWFSMQFWPLFNLCFSNVQVISDKKKNHICKALSLDTYGWKY